MVVTKLFLYILFGKEAQEMMAMLWAYKIYEGKKNFSQIPKMLVEQVTDALTMLWIQKLIDGKNTFPDVTSEVKDLVRDKLVEMGLEELITE